jgi:MFS superfamily sulfate permease-like transporter
VLFQALDFAQELRVCLPYALRTQDWFRVSPVRNTNCFIAIYNLAAKLGDTHYQSFLVGFTSLLAMAALKKNPRTRKLPGSLFIVLLYIIIMVIVDSVKGSDGAGECGCGVIVNKATLQCAELDFAGICSLMSVGYERRVTGCLCRPCLLAAGAATPARKTIAGINVVGSMSSKFPIPSFPPLEKAGDVIITAVFVMFIGFIESISVAKTYAAINK